MRALVAGGGIGGLTAALALAASGQRAQVFEQAGGLQEAGGGAGIQLSPNCTRVLRHLGLDEALRATACVPEAVEFRHWRTGRVLGGMPLGDAVLARYGAPYYHMHRGDLLAALEGAAREHPNIDLRLATRVESFASDDSDHYARCPPTVNGCAIAELPLGGGSGSAAAQRPASAKGAGGERGAGAAVGSASDIRLGAGGGDLVRVRTSRGELGGDLLVGADGIHSRVQELLWGGRRPVFTGNIAWRALVPAEGLPKGLARGVAGVWWGPGRHLVHYLVRRGELLNCVCVVEKSGWQKESWMEPGELAELQADFVGWHKDIDALLKLIDPKTLYKWALFDRQPMRAWSKGRATLLGDACHATLPFMAQGAAMAIEDAAVLAACLAQASEVPQALQRYQALRLARTRRVQQASRRNARIFHLRGPAAWLRNRIAKHISPRIQDSLYTYNPLTAHK